MTATDFDEVYDTPSPDNPIVRPTRFMVTCLPDDFPDANSWTIVVEPVPGDGDGRWRVSRRDALILNIDGDWDPFGGGAGDAWRARHWFPVGDALERAKQAAPHVVVMGMTPADALAWHAAGCPLPIPRPHSRARTTTALTEANQL